MNLQLFALAGQVALLVTAALVAEAFLRRRSAALRHWVLSAALVSAACLPALHLLAPRWDAGRWLAAAGPEATQLQPLEAPPGSAGATVSFETTALPDGSRGDEHAGMTLPGLLLAGWALGTGAALLLLAGGLARLQGLAARAKPLDHPIWTRLAAEVANSAGLRRRVTLLQSDHPAILAAWGWRRPVVLVPRAAATWPREDVEVVLRHEFAHVARGDWPLQLLGEAVRALNWFNPLLWLAARRLRLESERACDDAVLEQGLAGPDYAARLVGLARRLDTGQRWRAPFLAPAMAQPSSLERRIAAMLNTRLDRAPVTRSGRTAILCLALALALPVAGFAVLAQEAPGTFKGRVLDPTGKPMDARVMLLNTASGINPEIRTGNLGTFTFSGLPRGEYVVEVSQPGFMTLKTAVTMGEVGITRDFALQIGSLTESLHIRAAASATTRAPEKPAPGGPVNQPRARTAPCTADPASGGHIQAPRKLKDVKPDYSASLAAEKVVGDVVLQGVIGEDGTVRDLQVIETPHADLGRALIDAVSRWQFEPTLLNCEAVPVKMTVKARFEQ